MCTILIGSIRAVHDDHRVSGISYSITTSMYVCEETDHEDSLLAFNFLIFIFWKIFGAKCCIVYKYALFFKKKKFQKKFQTYLKVYLYRDPRNDSLLIFVCILRDLPHQKNPRALCWGVLFSL
jgi:hypothetical protein